MPVMSATFFMAVQGQGSCGWAACRSPVRRRRRVESERVHLLPAPAVGAHVVEIAARLPAELAARERGVGIARGHVARATRGDLVGDGTPAGALVGGQD